MNTINIVGNLGQDVEQKNGANNTPYWVINVATSESWKDKVTGENKTKTTWHRCSLNGNYSGLAPYLLKGKQVAISGSQRNERYNLKDNQGNNLVADGKELMSTLPYIAIRSIELVGGNGGGQNQAPAAQAQPNTAPAQTNNNTPTGPAGEDDDLPF